MKKLTSLILSIMMLFSMSFVVDADDTAEVIIDKATISPAGTVEVIGHLKGYKEGDQVTYLNVSREYKESGRQLSGDDIIYIDQSKVGNNGTFLFRHSVTQNWSDADSVLTFGSSRETKVATTELHIPELPPDLSIIDNNSVMYGRDLYYLQGAYTKDVDCIADSLAFGGNHIFFKIGDNYYDLLNSHATSNDYLVKENAVSISTVEKLVPRYYYGVATRYTLRYYVAEQEKQ